MAWVEQAYTAPELARQEESSARILMVFRLPSEIIPRFPLFLIFHDLAADSHFLSRLHCCPMSLFFLG